jgi:hypothetical protein
LARSNKDAGGFFGFQRPQMSLLERKETYSMTIWCLLAHIYSNRVAIMNSIIMRYLTLAKVG